MQRPGKHTKKPALNTFCRTADVCGVAHKIIEDPRRESEGGLPPAGKLVIVICDDENHLGYRDGRGRWRHAAFHRELLRVVGWCAISARGWQG